MQKPMTHQQNPTPNPIINIIHPIGIRPSIDAPDVGGMSGVSPPSELGLLEGIDIGGTYNVDEEFPLENDDDADDSTV